MIFVPKKNKSFDNEKHCLSTIVNILTYSDHLLTGEVLSPAILWDEVVNIPAICLHWAHVQVNKSIYKSSTHNISMLFN